MTTVKNKATIPQPNGSGNGNGNANGNTVITDQPQVPVPEELHEQLPQPSRTNSNGHKRNFFKKILHHDKKDKEEKHTRARSSTIHRSETHAQHHREVPNVTPPKRASTSQNLNGDHVIKGKVPTNIKNPFLTSCDNSSTASAAPQRDDREHGSSGMDVAGARDKGSGVKNGHYIPATPEGVSLSRVGSFNNAPLGSKASYQPYGQRSAVNTNHASGPSTTGGSTAASDDETTILPIPVHNPNDYLPDEYKQESIYVHEEYNIPEKNTKRLGSGGSAYVFIITSKKTGKPYAYKQFVMVNKETPEEFYKRAAKEYITTKRLNGNKHIIGCLQLKKSTSTQNLHRGWGFVLEYCEGGDLFNLVNRSGWRQHPIAEKYCLFKQICYGIRFIHSQGIVHRDLKLENCLITSNGCVKLTDFGVAECAYEDPEDFNSPIRLFTSYVGSPPHAAPEVTEIKPLPLAAAQKRAYNGFISDMWSLGVMMYILVRQNTPFTDASPNDIRYRDFMSSYTTYCQSNPQFRTGGDKHHGPGPEFKHAKDYQNIGAARVGWRLLDPSPKTRITLDGVFDDPWFKTVETCIQEDDSDDFEPKFIAPGSRISSFESGASKSMLDFSASQPEKRQSQSSSTKTSPIVKPRSMLDFSDIAPQQEQLPPLEEVDHEETHSSQLEVNIEPKKPSLIDCDLKSSAIDENEVFSEATSEENSPKSSPSATTPSHNNSYNYTTTAPNDSQASFQRAGSFSSLASRGSVTSSASKAAKRKHHHLDVSNVQNHGHGSTIKLPMR